MVQSPDDVTPPGPIVHPLPTEVGNPAHAVKLSFMKLQASYRGEQLCSRQFVSIEAQNPVVARLPGRPIFCRPIAQPFAFDHFRTCGFRQNLRFVYAAGVYNEHFLKVRLHRSHEPSNIGSFVFGHDHHANHSYPAWQ